MSDLKERASAILKEFKGNRYAFGSGVLDGAPGKFAAPNAPFVDVYRIHSHIVHKNPDVIVAAAGGSGIDAAHIGGDLVG